MKLNRNALVYSMENSYKKLAKCPYVATALEKNLYDLGKLHDIV
jgi:hypothetical protein